MSFIKDEYDIVIIGGGPCGLALAQCCANITNKILVLEKENTIGGCHRVRRIKYNNEELFTEHGPRIYSDRYKNLMQLLNEMNVNFYDLFVKYNFNISKIGQQTVWSTLSYTELGILTMHFIILMFNPYHGRHISLNEFTIKNKFKKQSIDIIDRICRLTDGADINRYTLNEFLQLINQHFFYDLYQPNLPNDKGLFKHWNLFLKNKGIDIIKNVEITNITTKSNNIDTIDIKINDTFKTIKGNKYVFAIPPKSLYHTLESIQSSNKNNTFTNSESQKSDILNSFGNYYKMKEYSDNTAYIDYISMTFHWDKDLSLPKIYGFPHSHWGIVFIVLSDYMKMEEKTSKTMISLAITINTQSPRINKTPDQCSESELFEEVYQQLLDVYPNLPKPTVSLLSPGVKYINNKWNSIDTAFVTSAGYDYIYPQSESINNMYTLGTHNGYHNYPFTSIEAAVTNSIKLSHILYPELKDIYNIKDGITIRDALFYIVILIIITKLIRDVKNK